MSEMSYNLLDENIVAQFSTQQINTYFSLYLKNASVLVDSIQKDFEQNNHEALRQRAHKLKGSSMVVGAVGMKSLAQEIEEAVKSKEDVSKDTIRQLQDQFQLLKETLKQRYNLGFSRG